ncbi:MAG TPA: prolyl oligopeptidase family serine peptidase [Candidatus Binatus sp.]|nr:prolyl oligopeptidase family serine peptidase [Candidatus Binatus sp.]
MSSTPSPPNTEIIATDDPYLWLEEVEGDRQFAWVREQNAASARELEAVSGFAKLRERLSSICESRERIPNVTKHGAGYYNFWRDEKHVRGLWRRTTLAEYRKAEPAWETVLNLDDLSEAEKENWVWKGANVLHPSHDRALIFLSRGGADAAVVREFGLVQKQFVTGGFTLPEAKSRVAWRDRDSLYVGTDFGADSLTSSGYPRIVKEWQRGTSITEAKTAFEGNYEDVSVVASVVHDHGRVYEFIARATSFFSSELLLRRGDTWVKLDKPADARVETFEDQILLRLRSDWSVGARIYRAGSLLAGDFEAYLRGERQLAVLFEPNERKALASTSATKRYLILNEVENVQSKVHALRREIGGWVQSALEIPAFGSARVRGVDADESDDYFMTATDFLTPSSLSIGTIGQTKPEKLKSLPAFFTADALEIGQHEAISKDGTRIPYFLVGKKDLPLNGRNPTLLYGYGGFNVSQLPFYSGTLGTAWLERGGVYALANIRGGGEFGPNWHYAACKENRQRAYDDFIAVAADVIARNVTSPKRLGIQGGSNGGLLVGVALTQRPDLFRAAVCQVPLLDMRRYHKLLAGASWIDEYGDPDKAEDWAYIKKYSPYHNVFAEKKYPRILFTTSTRDDRVHPGHARKMFAKMKAQGHDVLYYENIEGGHGGAANNQQLAYMSALTYSFLVKELLGD